MEITVNELAKAFSEWDRRYREDPEAFYSEASHLLLEDAETYGEEVAPYFVKILEDLKSDASAKAEFVGVGRVEWSNGYSIGYNQGWRMGNKK